MLERNDLLISFCSNFEERRVDIEEEDDGTIGVRRGDTLYVPFIYE